MASKEEQKAREAAEAKEIAAKFTSVLSLSESVAQGASVNPKFRKVSRAVCVELKVMCACS